MEKEVINNDDPTAPPFRRLTSDFGGNLEELDFELLDKISKKESKFEKTVENIKIGYNDNDKEEIASKKPEIQKSPSLKDKMKNNYENSIKSVTFKENSEKEKNNDEIKNRHPTPLVKSTSILKYEYPTLANELK